ncbi:MAG: RNA polymerase sigma factor [Alphaproteobacteria bacterium]
MQNLIKTHSKYIKSIIRNITGQSNEDIEQEVYIKAWQHQEDYKDEGKLKNWLSVITKHTCFDYIKSSKQKVFSNSCELDEERLTNKSNAFEEYSQKQRQKIILKEIYKLPKDLSKIIILYEFEGYKYDEIANKLKTSVPQIKNKLHKARKILAENLKFLKG